ncbi:UDP-glycosyltransferase 90A1 [Morella rubra]|uniref:Glycosyltransferase n=1 Tax=Morella rubra TaxID=262757 RepID=A0A6A1VHD7_9ROSI|nr:UDP-glycosyltransferase 90A1 [Morella rubra]
MTSKLHVVIFPFMSQGHTIPLLHLAKTLSNRGLKVTIVTTASNSSFIRSYTSRYTSIHLREIPFPHIEGIPEGCENTSQLLSLDQLLPFLIATRELRGPFEEILKDMSELQDPPACVISDSFLGWTNALCRAFGIPRLVFNGMGVFAMAVKKSLSVHQNHRGVTSDTEPVDVKGVNPRCALTVSDLPYSLREMDSGLSQFFVEAEKSDLGSWGVIVNSFRELEENDHVASVESLYGHDARAWCIGPLFLYDEIEAPRIGLNGPSSSSRWANCLNQSENDKSVLYVAFGTQTHLPDSQLDELAFGLELSGIDYIWVVRSSSWEPPSDVSKGRGVVVREWVDQKWAIAHRAIGGFLSHCGWNSVLESLSMGVPILAWPMQHEQHLNAKFLVEEAQVGIRVPTVMRDGKVVTREVICEAVKELMGEESGKRARDRASELGKLAKGAVQVGGSSYKCLNELIDQLSQVNLHSN